VLVSMPQEPDVIAETNCASRSSTDAPTPNAEFISLSSVPFTRDIDVGSFTSLSDGGLHQDASLPAQEPMIPSSTSWRRRTTHASTVHCAVKVGESRVSTTWKTISLPEPLSSVHRGSGRKYPNTPLSLVWYEQADECFMFVGLLGFPNLLKIIPPKYHEPDKGGRFNVLPINSQRLLLADDTSHQIWLINHQTKTIKHLAGSGKRGLLDGPLEICRMHWPCSLTVDPRSHYIYVADRGNHAIRKIDLLSGLMSTVVGNGCRGNSDGGNPRRQALDSPFEVSFSEPHHLIISCANNSVRCFNLKTGYLETILVGS